MTDDDLMHSATPDERVRAYHTPCPAARALLERAGQWRALHDHMAAGVLERDAAALVRMAQRDALLYMVAFRLGMRRDDLGRWRR